MTLLLVTISLHAERGGGTAERTRQLAQHLAALGTPCEVVTMEDGRHADDLRARGIPVHVTGHVHIRYHLPFLNPFRLSSLVRRADRVHILGYWNLLSVAIAWLARAAGRPYALSPAGEFASLDAPHPAARLFHRTVGRALIRHAAMLIAITPLEQRQIAARFADLAPPVVVVPNGVSIPPAPPAAPPEARHAVVFVGRLAPIKGPDLLVEAFAAVAPAHPDVQLIVAGPDFGLRASLHARVAALGLGRSVVFVDYVDEAARTALFARALLACAPSRAEAMSLVALEAGAAGVPVLLTDQCGFDDVALVDGGAVVPATVEGLAGGLMRLLADRDALPAKGRRLYAHVVDRYAWPTVCAALRDHLAALPEGPRRPQS